MTDKIVLADGTVYDAASIISCTFTEQVNDQEDICPGAAVSSELEIELRAGYGSIKQGDTFTYYKVNNATDTKIGVFTADKPEKTSEYTYRILAYDNISRTYSSASEWLRANQSAFPMSLYALVQAACTQCGLVPADSEIPNGDFQVQAFYADGVTWQNILQWAGQVACRFVKANADGEITFAWYQAKPNISSITPGAYGEWTAVDLSGELLGTHNSEIFLVAIESTPYKVDSLTFEEYKTALLDKVQIRQTDDDVGVIYPADETGKNTYAVQGNMLLAPTDSESLRPIAQSIYNVLYEVQYTPGEISIFPTLLYRAGDIIPVTPQNGDSVMFYITKAVFSDSGVVLTCTGNPSRDSVSAVNEQQFSNMQGNILDLQMGVEGLRVTNKNLQGQMAQLELDVDGFRTEVEKELSDMTDYIDTETGQIKDEAVNDAVQQAVQQVDQKLTFYPTTSQMNSAIQQSASEINLSVSQKLTGYSTTSQMHNYVDGQLASYPTTVEMNSAIQQSASEINLSVTQKLTMYPTDSEMHNYVDGQVANLPSTSTVQNMIDVGIDGISLSASTNGNTSTIRLTHDGATISSANITFSGFVTFSDLSGSGTTTINGDNITAGSISAANGKLSIDLDTGTFSSGTSSSSMVFDSGVLTIYNGGSIVLYNNVGQGYVLRVGENGMFNLPECSYFGNHLIWKNVNINGNMTPILSHD